MNNLVFLDPNKIDAIPFTTSDVIAEFSGVSYRSIQRLIDSHESDFSEFGRVRFEITPSQTNGGIQNKKIYQLNEEQATLLMTYLRNTDRVREFKKNLVRQFYAMRSELMKRRIERVELKPIRRELTDVIQEVDSSKWAYKKYTDLAYKSSVGKNAAQLRAERKAPKKSTAIDYMTADEIAAVSKRTSQIGVLLEMGMDYEQVKALVLEHKLMGTVANAAIGACGA
ncbi:Phage regulatory protein Rha [anaerobic digester metagenome]